MEEKGMEATGKTLVEHWDWAAKKGEMNTNTAGGLRSACVQVLSVLDNWEAVDIRTLDVEATLLKFQNLKAKKVKSAVLKTYKRRFSQAVTLYLAYLDDPAGWKPRAVERPASGEKTNGADRSIVGRVTKHEAPQAGLAEYPFPIREGLMARLVLPRDLKAAEAKRLTAFLSILVVDTEPREGS